MKQTVFIVGIEQEEARKAALQFADRGYLVYGAVTKEIEDIGEAHSDPASGIRTFELNPLSGAQKAAALLESEIGSLDILVLQAGFLRAADGDVTDGHDCAELSRILDFNVQGCREIIEAFLPLLRKGNRKRIALLTDAAASVGNTQETANYAYHMSIASLDMLMKLYFNRLRPEGFTFRAYAGGNGGMCAAEYIGQNFCYDEKEPYIHSEENRYVMRNSRLQEVPW